MHTHDRNSMAPAGRKTRVAVVGCGKMGLQHVRAIGRTAGAELVGVADPSARPAALQAVLPAGTRIFTDPAALLDEVKPDVVHVVTPPATHATLAAQALNAQAHVYVEKPFTPSAAEARMLFDLAAERGLQLCAGHQLLFERPMMQLGAALPLIGSGVEVASYMAFRTVRRNITPVDQVNDVLPHAVYLLLGALPKPASPVEVTAVDVDARGEVYLRIRSGTVRGSVTLTLNGRPVQQYLEVVGTNGSLRADFITGAVVSHVGPGASAPAVLLAPYLEAWQSSTGATGGFWRRFRAGGGYPGLAELFARFYASVQAGGPPPIPASDILETVTLCEQVGRELESAYQRAEADARERLTTESARFATSGPKRTVLVTGGSGFLGRRVSAELRDAGYKVRVAGRSAVPCQFRLAGVEYVRADLANRIDASLLSGVNAVVHCAAETAGGKEEHEANSIRATRNLIGAAGAATVDSFVHVSSLAVLASGRGRPLDESAAIETQANDRGPYVWGKVEAEAAVTQARPTSRMHIRIVRPGPLVDFASFSPPGRLGREVGPLFVAVGPKRAELAVCDVGTAARVLRWYVDNPDAAPPVLNLVEAVPPTRRELVERLRSTRPDLRVVWLPGSLLRVLSGTLKVVQRLYFRGRPAVDVYAAFASERYATRRAADVIRQAKSASAGRVAPSTGDGQHQTSDTPAHIARDTAVHV